MTCYLIRDDKTGRECWTPADTVTDALRRHEAMRRDLAGEAPLPPKAKASHDSIGDIIQASLGDSSIRGLRKNVVLGAEG